MNINLFYDELFEKKLGLSAIGLESHYRTLVKLIENETLLTLAQYIPCKYLLYLDISDRSNMVAKSHNTIGAEYYLTDPTLERFNLPILGIESIKYNSNSEVDPYDPSSTEYYQSVIASRNNLTLESMLMGAEYTYNRTLTDFAYPFKRYHELRGGNILYLKNYTYEGVIEVTIKTRYPNLASIPDEYREVVFNLAKYDCEIYLWSFLKYLRNIVTPAGNADLMVDWDGAEREREDFLKDLRAKTLPDRVGANYFTII